MKRIMTVIAVLLVMTLAAQAAMFQIQIVDIDRSPVLDCNAVTIYLPGTSTEATIYTNEAKTTAVTNPITTGLADGLFEFWGDMPYYDIMVSSDTYTGIVKRDGIRPTTRRFFYAAAESVAGSISTTGAIATTSNLTVGGDANLAGDVNLGSTTGDKVLVFGQTDFGVDDSGVDINIYGDTTANLTLFDASLDAWVHTSIDTWLDDSSILYLGTDKDWSVKSNAAKNLNILPVTTDETSIINIGADTAGADLKLFAATTGDYVLWDASDEALEVTDSQIHLEDGAILQLGTDKDFALACATAATLGITPLATDESPIINVGADTSGVDLKLFAATTGKYILWDASADKLLGVGGPNEMGFRKEVELFAANDTLTADESGKVCVSVGKGTPGDLVFTLPAAKPGLVFTFVDANATPVDDLWITAGTGDKINGGTAGKSYKCTGDAVKQSLTIVAIDDTDWVILAENGTWFNDNN